MFCNSVCNLVVKAYLCYSMTKEGKIPLHKSTPPEITTERITANSKKKKKKPSFELE